jgi:hypothetical protein
VIIASLHHASTPLLHIYIYIIHEDEASPPSRPPCHRQKHVWTGNHQKMINLFNAYTEFCLIGITPNQESTYEKPNSETNFGIGLKPLTISKI